MAYIHEKNIIHRDIKPANIMRRTLDKKLMLIDFGIVKQVEEKTNSQGQTSITVSAGTRGYMPPEQSDGHPKFSSDIYALGMTAIQFLTGISPDKMPKDPDTLEVIWLYKVNISSQLADILTKMIKYHFKERYHNAGECLTVVEKLSIKSPRPGNNSSLNINNINNAMRSPLVKALYIGAIALWGAFTLKTFVLDKQAQNKPTPTVTNTPEKKEVKLERGKFISLVDDIQLSNIKDARKTVSLPSNSIIQILGVHPKGSGEKIHNLVKLEICLDAGAIKGKQPVKEIFVIEESDLKEVEIKEEENPSDYGNCKEIDLESPQKGISADKADYKLSKKE